MPSHRDDTFRRVFEWWDYPVFIVLTAVVLFAIGRFLTYWFSGGDWERQPVTFLVLTLLLLGHLAVNQLRWLSVVNMRRPGAAVARPGARVGVATTFVPAFESFDMLAATVRALAAMEYDHETWVLDEGDDERVRDLCQQVGVFHYSRKHRPEYQADSGPFKARTKYGNYNAWLADVGFEAYDIVVAFDPDHVPQREFLSELLGYFDDPQIGFVQAAQAYYNQAASFIARGAAEETYNYYAALQMSGHAAGLPIVTGCHNLHRVSALREVGGFAPHEADDLLVTLLYRAKGWRGVYVPRILARGLVPVDWRSYLEQQRRWARSVIDIKLRRYSQLVWCLPPRTNLAAFLHGWYYLSGVSTPVSLIVLSVMLATGAVPTALSVDIIPHLILLYGALMSCDLYRQRFFLDPRTERGWHWRSSLLQFAKWPHVVLGLLEGFAGRQLPYTITPKGEVAGRNLRPLWPHAATALVLATSLVYGVVLGHASAPWLQSIALVLLVVCIGLFLTGFRRWPPPYDVKLRERMLCERRS